jgi:hypothetical protein
MPKLWPIIILGYVTFATSFGAHIVTINLPPMPLKLASVSV